MKNNLVIGSDGFVGNSLCRFLESRGEKAIRFDIKRGEHEDARKAALPLENIDRVYFLAWEVGGAKYLYKKNTQLHQLKWNVRLLDNVLLQIEKHKKPFIFASSQLAEEIDTVYGATKRLGELWAQQLGGACARFWNIYGALEDTSERSHVAGDFVNQAIATGKIRMMTTGEEKRQFIHITDACAGVYHIMENNRTDAIYDITSFEWVTIKKFADIIAGYANAEVIPGTEKGLTRNITATKGKPQGWSVKISLEDGIKMMVDEALEKYKQ